MRTHNNHAMRQRGVVCLVVGSPDGRYGTKPGPVFHRYMFILRLVTVLRMALHNTRTGWKRNISICDETAHMLLITGRSTICSYVAFVIDIVSCLFNHIADERTS